MKQIHEFWVTDDTDEAVRKSKITMKRVGELTRVVPGENIEGEVKFGMHPVRLNVTWRTETAQAAADAAAERRAAAAVGAEGAKLPPAQAALLTTAAAVSGGMGTTIVLEVDDPDHTGAPHRNVTERFEDAYMHFDRPDYAPDRLGVLPVTIVFVLVALFIMALLIMNTSRIRQAFGVHETPPSTVEAPATPS